MDGLADSHGNGTLKLTNRQAFQLHGVVKGKLRPAIREINRALKDAELEGRTVDGDEVIVDWDAAAGRYRADAAP